MQVVYFSFKDEWFDLASFALRSIMHPFSIHDGTLGKYRQAWNKYLSSLV